MSSHTGKSPKPPALPRLLGAAAADAVLIMVFAAVGERRPVPVHGGLVLTVHHERDRFREAGAPGTVECREPASFQFKVDGDCLTGDTRSALTETRNIDDP